MNERRGVKPILIVEDSDEDFEVTCEALRMAGVDHPIKRCPTGRDAMDYVHKRGAYGDAQRPSLVFLDLNLPGVDGRQLLREMRSVDWLKTAAKVVLTTSANPRDIDHCYCQGAHGYLVKPVDLEKFEAMIRHVAEYWLCTVHLAPGEDELA